MNKNKISSKLLNKISILSNHTPIFVTTSNQQQAIDFLQNKQIDFLSYNFANSFYLLANQQDIKTLSMQPFVDFIYANEKVNLQSFYNTNIEKLTENKYYGQNQTICFIDTGIYPHFDFLFPHNRIIKFVDLINKNLTPYDDNGHGTFVCGVACGNGTYQKTNSGIAPQAKIVVIKALSSLGNADSNTILDAMQWVYENHKKYGISVVCMSFGADMINLNDPLSRGAEALWKQGLVVVSACGNSGPQKSTIKSPGTNPYIITVGALDSNTMQVADFSSRGPTVFGHKPDLIAPAVDVVSCNIHKIPYTKMSGTSVATPIVAGICAVIKSKYPRFTNNQVKQFLLSHCKKLTGDIDTEGAGFISF